MLLLVAPIILGTNVSSLVKILEGNGESPIFVQKVTEMKLNLYRDKTQDAQVSNLTIFGYALPSIVIFVLLAVLIVDPFFGSLGILQYAWWLVLILIISAPVVFFRALKKGGVLKKAKLLLSAINLVMIMLLLFVRLPAYACDAVEMAKHYDRKTEQFDKLVTYAYSASFQQKPGKFKRLLRKTGCKSIDTSNPEYCELVYKHVCFDSYVYRIYRVPMSEEAFKEYSKRYDFIPHDSRMVMKYSGGATSEGVFPYAQRERYYKKYPKSVEYKEVD